MSYYDDKESVANIYHGLVQRGWKCYGYKADESDSMTDYWSPARWDGIAEKDGYILLVDVYGTSDSGRKVTKQGFHADYNKIQKLEALMNDSASTEGEKASCKVQLEKLYNKENESIQVVNEYPTYTQGNPKGCNWHIEKDGAIIAKGKGAYQCDGYLFGGYEEETMKKVNAFIDRIETYVNSGNELQKVVKKVVKKVIKPVQTKISLSDFVKNETIIKLNSDFTGGHYNGELLQFIRSNTFMRNGQEITHYSFVKLGKKYQQLKLYGAANNILTLEHTRLIKWLESESILTMELKEVEEVTEKVTYKKVKSTIKNSEQLLETEQQETTEETKKETVKKEMVNPEDQATKKQLWALHLATKRTIDTRNINITKKDASELIGRSKQGEDITEELKAILNGESITETTHNSEPEKEQEEKAEQETEETTGKVNENPYNNDIVETPSGYYCHFKSWDIEPDDIKELLNKHNIPFVEAFDKFIFSGLTNHQFAMVKIINDNNGSILFDDSNRHEEQQEETTNNNVIDINNKLNNNKVEESNEMTFDILNKFDNVTIENDNRISDYDKAYCEQQEKLYNQAIEALKTAYNTFKQIYDKNQEENKNVDRYDRSYIDKYRDLDPLEKRIREVKQEFISQINGYFQKQYNVTIESREIKNKYDDSVTYENIVDEIFEQLGGLNFEEKAVNELKEASRNTIYRSDKVKINKNKISITDFIYWDNWSWSGTKISWGENKLRPLFKALSHFERKEVEMIPTMNNIYNEFQEGTQRYNILDKYNMEHLNKVKAFRAFKNGRVDIEFASNELAQKFYNEYLRNSQAA